MSNACTPILVDVTSPVSEILLHSKTAKFPFLTMDYSQIYIRKFNRLESAQKVHANRVLLFFNLFSMSLRNTCMLLNLNNFKILYYFNAAQNLQDKMIENWPFLKVVISPKAE